MITQTLNNIYQSGASEVEAIAYFTTLTPHQFYFVVGCITLIILVLSWVILSTIRGYILKSCAGCKRLKKCEAEILRLKIISKTYGTNLETIYKLLDKILGGLKK